MANGSSVSGEREPSSVHTQAHATARKTESLIRHEAAKRSLTDLAAKMSCSTSTLSRWMSEDCGIPISKIGELLHHLGLQVLSDAKVAAYDLFLKEYVAGKDDA